MAASDMCISPKVPPRTFHGIRDWQLDKSAVIQKLWSEMWIQNLVLTIPTRTSARHDRDGLPSHDHIRLLNDTGNARVSTYVVFTHRSTHPIPHAQANDLPNRQPACACRCQPNSANRAQGSRKEYQAKRVLGNITGRPTPKIVPGLDLHAFSQDP